MKTYIKIDSGHCVEPKMEKPEIKNCLNPHNEKEFQEFKKHCESLPRLPVQSSDWWEKLPVGESFQGRLAYIKMGEPNDWFETSENIWEVTLPEFRRKVIIPHIPEKLITPQQEKLIQEYREASMVMNEFNKQYEAGEKVEPKDDLKPYEKLFFEAFEWMARELIDLNDRCGIQDVRIEDQVQYAKELYGRFKHIYLSKKPEPQAAPVNSPNTAEQKVVKALRNLVHLKDWKDKHGKDHHYEQFQPEAWSYAREAIEDYEEYAKNSKQ